MMKLRILDMKEFLKTVNECAGPVNLVDSDGRRVNINKEYGIQAKLQAEYQRNRKILSLCLEVPTPEDYLSIVYYYVGDC
ncbi:ribonuclease HII [Hungatella hathewayi]|uniref:ribonuclease HII n=1 Tax=Hungatella hathewayi TaxID=154046 RepID=UPI003565F0D4